MYQYELKDKNLKKNQQKIVCVLLLLIFFFGFIYQGRLCLKAGCHEKTETEKSLF